MCSISDLVGRFPGALFYLLSAGVAFSAIQHVVFSTETMWIAAGKVAIPIIGSLSLVYTGYRISSENLTWRAGVRILSVTVGLGLVAMFSVVLIVVVRALEGDPIGGEGYVLFLALTAGLGSGAPMGYYYQTRQAQAEELARRYAEIQSLHKRLSISHRVLRHNVRNELTIIQGYTDEVLKNPDHQDAQARLETVRTHQTNLQELTEKMKLLRGVWETPQTIEMDLSAVVANCVKKLRHDVPAVTVATNIHDVGYVLAHPQLATAITEALENAVEHNDETVVELTVTVRSDSGPAGYHRIEVADTGTGLPEVEQRALDKPQETALEHGLGLGLWFIQAVLEQSNGDLSVLKSNSQGTVLAMDLPSRDKS